MKLIYAGVSSNQTLDYSNYLFNCRRNKSCQKSYYVPLRSFVDVMLYVDLPGKPDTVQVKLVDLCSFTCEEAGGDFNDDYSNDFFINGQVCTYERHDVIFSNYVVGQKPDNSWYGVFSNPNNPVVGLRTFYLQFTFTVYGQEHIYYSEQFEIDYCDRLLLMQACYPNEVPPADARDCNGVYYGFPASNDYLGSKNFRYFHKAYVRKGSVFGFKNKLSFSFFNSKRTYKTQSTRQKLLEFELVPEFYKDVILGIMELGNVALDNQQYRLEDEQNWQVLDYDSKLWQLDTVLTDECKQYFGCKPFNCILPAEDCGDGPQDVDVVFDEGEIEEGCCEPVIISATVEVGGGG